MRQFRFNSVKRIICALSVGVALTAAIWVSPTVEAIGSPDSKGTDFWLAFPGNSTHNGTLSLFITGDANTSGSVSIPGFSFSTPFSVIGGTVTTVAIPTSADISSSDVVESKGIHVTALDE